MPFEFMTSVASTSTAAAVRVVKAAFAGYRNAPMITFGSAQFANAPSYRKNLGRLCIVHVDYFAESRRPRCKHNVGCWLA